MRGRCMCGDYLCPSCGPAQGNSRCDVCGSWESEGGCENPEECQRIGEERDREMYEEWKAQELRCPSCGSIWEDSGDILCRCPSCGRTRLVPGGKY